MLSKEIVIKKIKSYKPCDKCNKVLPKTIPLCNLNIENRKRKCQCGKAHIDDIMIEVFNVIKDAGEYDNIDSINLRNIGIPLVDLGYPLKYLPVLGENELIIMADISKECAKEVIKTVDEVKGIICLNRGAHSNSLDVNKLLAGDDFRCDIFPLKLLKDCIIVCKNQSKVHIEFPRPFNPKISKVEQLNLKDKVVIDGFCGAGTLGMIALKKGAKKVIFCDINNHALYNLRYNLKLNFNENIFNRVELFNCDFLDLDVWGDVCLIDLFPYMDVNIYLKKAREIAEKVIII